MFSPSFRYRSILVSALSCMNVVFFSCAKETSKEERRREESDRQFRRLQKAEGHYDGFISIDANRIVPLSLDLSANRTPANGSDNPSLTASVRIGLLGGVTLSTSIVSFDWGNGNVTISLPKQAPEAKSDGPAKQVRASTNTNEFSLVAAAPPSAALEIRGSINDDGLANGVIDGPISGNHPVTLLKEGVNLFTAADRFTYQTQISSASLLGGEVVNKSQFDLQRLTGTHPASNSSDLPSLTSFQASIRFADLSTVPQNATDVIYDPILGLMDLQFGSTTTLRVENIFLNRNALNVALSDWHPDAPSTGRVFLGASQYGSIRIGSEFPGLGLTNPPAIGDVPPKYYAGRYVGQDPNAPPIIAIAKLEYTKTQGTNSAEYPFASFPMMTITIQTCSGGGKLHEYREYLTTAFDQIRNTVRFGRSNHSDPEDPVSLDFAYTAGWQTIVGKFSASGAGGVDVANPQLTLSPRVMTKFDCASVPD